MPEEYLNDLGLKQGDNLPAIMEKLEKRRQGYLHKVPFEGETAEAVYQLCAELCELEKVLVNLMIHKYSKSP